MTGLAVEHIQGSLGKTMLVAVHLDTKAVARHKGNLHTREEGRAHHRYQKSYNKIRHGYLDEGLKVAFLCVAAGRTGIFGSVESCF